MLNGYVVRVHQDKFLGASRKAGDFIALADISAVSGPVLHSLVEQGILEPAHDDPKTGPLAEAIDALRADMASLSAKVDKLLAAPTQVVRAPLKLNAQKEV